MTKVHSCTSPTPATADRVADPSDGRQQLISITDRRGACCARTAVAATSGLRRCSASTSTPTQRATLGPDPCVLEVLAES